MTTKKLAALMTATALVLAACSGGTDTAADEGTPTVTSTPSEASSDEAPSTTPQTTVEPTLPPVEEEVVADDGESVWTLTGLDINDPSWSLPVDPIKVEEYDWVETPLGDVEVYHAAMRKTQEYLLTAWQAPFDAQITDRDAIASWTGLLAPTADERWTPGPTWQNYQNPVDYKVDTVAAPDLRMALWAGRPDAPLEERWYSDVTYDYILIDIVTSATAPSTGADYAKVAIERSPSGALRAIYIPWSVEVGFTVNGDHPDAGRHVRFAYGTAKWVPTGDIETDLLLETPDTAVDLGAPKYVLIAKGTWTINNDEGRFSVENRAVTSF